MIELKNVIKTYGSNEAITYALRGVNLTIHEGEMVAIMGPAGSGKSTLLNIMGGMDKATEGEYSFGKDREKISNLSEKKLSQFRRKNVSFVFQNFALLNEYTVYENVEIPLRARGIKHKKDKILDSLDIVGLREKAKKKPSELSGGEKQRCAIARAIVSNTPVLLADEPTGSLDRESGEKIMKCFSEIHKGGSTIIIITHDPKVAECCDRTIFMEDGIINENLFGEGHKV